jgi:hypothetical protein
MKTEPHPIIFLDIDGVLCTQKQWKPEIMAEDGYSQFNQRCVEKLNTLVEQTHAKVILTSSRRINKTLEAFAAIMRRRGFTGELLGKINDHTELSSVSREDEIRQWLEKHGEPARYVIIDDDARIARIGEPYVQHWVRTTYHRGLDEEALERALLILKAKI